MEASTEIKDRIRRLNERLARYIPPRETWTPADEAVFTPVDLCPVPIEESQAMQLRAIRHAFTRHYTFNQFYHKYCEMRGITPEHIRTYDDLESQRLQRGWGLTCLLQRYKQRRLEDKRRQADSD